MSNDTRHVGAQIHPPLGNLDQIGVVVADLDAVQAGMRRVFGLEPRHRSLNEYSGGQFHRQQTDNSVDVMLYDFGGLELEFLAPCHGPSTWRDFLNDHGQGIHHVRFRVPDHAATHADMRSRGVNVEQEGDSVRGGGVHYAYYDTVPLVGFFLETLGPCLPNGGDRL